MGAGGAGAESAVAEPAGTGLSAGAASLLMGAIVSGAGGGASGTGGARGEQVAAVAALGRGGGLDERLGLSSSVAVPPGFSEGLTVYCCLQ